MDSKKSDLNPASIIDLKAELFKKYESFRKAKLDQSLASSKPTRFKSKGEIINDKKQKPAPIVKQKEVNDEEELALKKSRLALEAKAKLYEKIVSNKILIDDEQNDSYQVDFQRKVLYNSVEPKNSASVENQNDSAPAFEEHYRIPSSSTSSLKSNTENITTNNPDQPIHYQNVQFKEVRDHGTGYFAFSEDETLRKEQMEELLSMRLQTEQQRLAKEKLQNKRKAILYARLSKICKRNNIDESVLEEYKTPSETDNVDATQTQVLDLSSIPLPEPKQETSKKPTKVRPWDIGKDTLQHFVPEKKQKTRSQNDWIEEKREERRTEFAPPSLYR